MAGKGIRQLRSDIAQLPPRYQCTLDQEIEGHCIAEIEGVRLGIWLDDVCLYPTQHIAHVFPADDSQGDTLKTPFPSVLQSMQLSGAISEMLFTISSTITAASDTPASFDSDDGMTEIETAADSDEFDDDDDDADYSDGDDWVDAWTVKRTGLLKGNYTTVMMSDIELLQDIDFIDEHLEGLIWTKIPIIDLLDAQVFSQMQADTWGLSNDLSVWILFHIEKSDEDFKVYIRQADHDAIKPRDIVKNQVPKNQVLCVLETFIRKTVIRVFDNTFLYVGKLVLERLGDIQKYCSICGDKSVDIPSLKPFCCEKALCQHQFMYMDLNGELEALLVNEPFVVELLVQLAYVAARSGQLKPYPDCLAGEDDDSIKDCTHICQLLNKMSPVNVLAEVAQKPNGLQEHLKQIDHRLLRLLRWCVMSNTAHLKQLDKPEQMLVAVGKDWHQFKMTISTPQKEAVFQQHKQDFSGRSIFAWHGSPLSNWHSILRTGLNYDHVLHGRAYGNGMYFAFQMATSLSYCGYYGAHPWNPGYPNMPRAELPSSWKNAAMEVTTMLSVNEIVLDEKCFVNTSPYLVVNDCAKVQTRYLLIRALKDKVFSECEINVPKPLDHVTYHDIPEKYLIWAAFENIYSAPSHYLPSSAPDAAQSYVCIPKESFTITRSDGKKPNKQIKQLDLPSYASPTTTRHLQKELLHLLKTDSTESAIFSIDRTKLDNLYTWRAYLHNFSSDLPLSQDLLRLSLSNIEIEIKFGPQHPLTPPFIRVVQPRFLSFAHGGGGHVTAGGSLCMSVLTMDDWSPVYSISQVLVMVHSALSSVDPRPAKIADRGSYSEHEAMDAYLRVAGTHGWRVPEGWALLFTK